MKKLLVVLGALVLMSSMAFAQKVVTCFRESTPAPCHASPTGLQVPR